MLEEQEVVRGRIFTVQDVMQSTKRAWLHDRHTSLTHNLVVFGGCGLVLSIITGLFEINFYGIPENKNTPFALDSVFSIKLDVFSFGVLVLESVSGKKNKGFIHSEHDNNLLGHAWRMHNEGKSMELIDTNLSQSCNS
ncbi:unnamed protein product [Lactuca virosa]|uniref:Serine-threonine/tyrosine-protein kinase catalytic domain-containing protein n=1 Tax=Lactuca virosa TaxID=75947 RepID=A0AAU9N8H1_9ASTR|nr:unnamed protein product [Lactuca virosa]